MVVNFALVPFSPLLNYVLHVCTIRKKEYTWHSFLNCILTHCLEEFSFSNELPQTPPPTCTGIGHTYVGIGLNHYSKKDFGKHKILIYKGIQMHLFKLYLKKEKILFSRLLPHKGCGISILTRILTGPMDFRIRIRIGPPHPIVYRKRRLNVDPWWSGLE
jgi:hypothetical protein